MSRTSRGSGRSGCQLFSRYGRNGWKVADNYLRAGWEVLGIYAGLSPLGKGQTTLTYRLGWSHGTGEPVRPEIDERQLEPGPSANQVLLHPPKIH